MRVLQTNAFRKQAGSWDDQPGFVDRDVGPGGIGNSPSDPSEEEILDGFDPEKRKKRRRKRRTKRIYKLGIDVPLSPREERQPLITL